MGYRADSVVRRKNSGHKLRGACTPNTPLSAFNAASIHFSNGYSTTATCFKLEKVESSPLCDTGIRDTMLTERGLISSITCCGTCVFIVAYKSSSINIILRRYTFKNAKKNVTASLGE